jgi:hypothetical protein
MAIDRQLLLGNRQEAEDAVQNCLLQAFCKLGQFNHEGSFCHIGRILSREQSGAGTDEPREGRWRCQATLLCCAAVKHRGLNAL